MQLSKDSIYWIFSTLPQVIAALSGLLITGITYLFTILDQEANNDSSMKDIIDGVKSRIFGGVKYLIIDSIIAILLDVIILGRDEVIAEWLISSDSFTPFENGVLWLLAIFTGTTNLIYFYTLYDLLDKSLNPTSKEFVKQEIAGEIMRESNKIESKQRSWNEEIGQPNAPVSVNTDVFFNHFRDFESLARQLAPSNFVGGKQEPMYSIVRRLVTDRLLPEEKLPVINEMIKIRNIYAHGGDIPSVPKSLDDELLTLTKTLRDNLRKFNHKNSNSKGFFDSWISENVDDLTDAYELLQAIQFHQDYGSYRVSELKDNLLKISAYGPKPLYLSSKNTTFFINLLEKRFSEGELSIEDAFNFRQSLDKDRDDDGEDDDREDDDDSNDNVIAPV